MHINLRINGVNATILCEVFTHLNKNNMTITLILKRVNVQNTIVFRVYLRNATRIGA